MIIKEYYKNNTKKILNTYNEFSRWIKISILISLISLFIYNMIKLKFGPFQIAGIKSGHFFSVFVFYYAVWFTDCVIILNFFVCSIFLGLLLFKPNKLGNKYNFWKKYNTVYAIYLFTIYNLALLIDSHEIFDFNAQGHIKLTSWIDHEIDTCLWFLYCMLDKNTLTRINNKKQKLISFSKESFYISLFAGAFILFDAFRNYLLANKFGPAIRWYGAPAYPYIDYYTRGWQAFGYEVLGAVILYTICFSLMLYWNRKNKNLFISYVNYIIKLISKYKKQKNIKSKTHI